MRIGEEEGSLRERYLNKRINLIILLLSLFQDIQEVGHITNPLAREYGIRVYLCQKPRASFNQFWKLRVQNL